jgi:hypothetical protein
MQGHQADAENRCKRAAGIYERIGGDPLDIAMALEDHAAVLRKAGHASEAEKLEARARSLRESRGLPQAPGR